MNLKSQKGYSLLEIGVGLVIIVVFMYYSVTMLKATYNTYRYVEQRNIVMAYLIKSIENALLDDVEMPVTDNPANTQIQEDTKLKKVVVTTIPSVSDLITTNTVITTTIEVLPSKNGKSYENSPVKLVTAEAEYYTRTSDPTSKRTMTLQTLKIGGKALGT